jgi:RNA-directed DNA polymerase
MRDRIEQAIFDEAEKLVKRHQRYVSGVADEIQRRRRRSGLPVAKALHTPAYWKVDRGFDPYWVRSNAATIAYAVKKRLAAKSYAPRPAVSYEVPKADGGTRIVSVFQVADNAVSRLVFKALLNKNLSRLSARCYAYRTDVTLHDAVIHIASEFSAASRLFLAEYDFKKFFDSIAHEHIQRILDGRRFYLTPVESRIIWAFLKAPTIDVSTYDFSGGEPRATGIPQGTSISLFLANVVAFPLDYRLEQLGVGFARYADDTLIWSDDYARICEATHALNQAAQEMGVEVNLQKSEGVSILADPGAAVEFKGKSRVTFVGYSIGRRVIGIKQSAIARIKEHISYLIYANLVEEPKRGHIVPERFTPPVDRDYVVMVYQIRRFLYGDLSESQLRRYLVGHVPEIHYRGVMSFYPIVDDVEAMKALDGWLLHTVWTALRTRGRIMGEFAYNELPLPHGLKKIDLLRLYAVTANGERLDVRLPSFARIAKMMRRASIQYGPNAIANPQSGQYYPS